MKKNYYAVRKGLVPGIYTDWDSAKVQVTGFPGAEYKGFVTEAEAKEYLGIVQGQSGADVTAHGGGAETDDDSAKAADNTVPVSNPVASGSAEASERPLPEPGCAVAYVDGSFKESAGRFSYGIVMFIRRSEDDGEVEEIRLNKAFSNHELLENVFKNDG